MKILILGANGFIGSHLSEAILRDTSWQIHALDIHQNNLEQCIGHERFHFKLGDMLQSQKWIADRVAECDVVLPLVAIANPSIYVQAPLRVFELDFEANLTIVRLCVEKQKRLIFPSTSEVYGMCSDEMFDEEKSHLVTGPIHKERWIYSASKQLMDRVIYAYGKHHGLQYTLFRPFNWYGPRLDNIFNPRPGGSRVLTQFIGNILRGENIHLVEGGKQQRCFAYIDDGIAAILKMIENPNAVNNIFNVGNPSENFSIRTLAEKLLTMMKRSDTQLIDVSAKEYYGEGYQDVMLRVPSIEKARALLSWEPCVDLESGLRKTLDYYLKQSPLPQAGEQLCRKSSRFLAIRSPLPSQYY